MSLNTIKLDAQLLADLYPEQLIDTGTTTVPENSAKSEVRSAKGKTGNKSLGLPETTAKPEVQRANEKAPPKYLGNNGKKILVFVSHASVPFLPDDELNFLTSILAACKLSLADIGIANFQKMELEEIDSLIQSEGKEVLLFGPGPSDIGLPINFPQFQLQPFNKRTYLYAPTLNELENDKEQKKQLWNSLKKLFGL
jgi:hypothetical protein